MSLASLTLICLSFSLVLVCNAFFLFVFHFLHWGVSILAFRGLRECDVLGPVATPPHTPKHTHITPAPLQSLIRVGMPRVAAACRHLWPQRGSLWPTFFFFKYMRLKARWGRQKHQVCQPGGGNKCSCSYSLSPLPYTDYRREQHGWVQSSTLRLPCPTCLSPHVKRQTDVRP